MTGVAEVLNAAADLLEKPGAWTQGAFARHENGNPIGPLEDNASCWCVSGAIQKVEGRTRYSRAWETFSDYALERGFARMEVMNDAPGRTQSEVVAALRAAAEAAQ